MKTEDETLVDLLLFEKTGFIDVNAISWKNVARLLCLDVIERIRKQAQKDLDNPLKFGKNFRKSYEDGYQKAQKDFEERINKFWESKREWLRQPETVMNSALIQLVNLWEEELKQKLGISTEGEKNGNNIKESS